MYIDHYSILFRVLAALLCGALLGAEREYRGREAGLKTHISLSIACCLAILVSAFGFSDAVTQGLIGLDPSRIAAGVEGGIGFACAAVIWRSRNKVIGLTTAINIWATANIGMACGAGMFFAAALITGCILFIHTVVAPIERRFFPHHNACTISVSIAGAASAMQRVGALATQCGVTLTGLHLAERGVSGAPATVELELGQGLEGAHLRFMDALAKLDGVKTVDCTGFCSIE